MALANFRMINNDLVNKDTDVVPYQAPLIVLYINSAVCMANNLKDTKHTRHISRIIHFVINGEELNLHNTVWCEVGLPLADIGTNNVIED